MANIRASLGFCQKSPQHTGKPSVRNGGLREVSTILKRFKTR